MEFEELPDSIRVKLEDSAEQELWSRVESRGGVKKFARDNGFDSTRLYNWRSKDVFIPVVLVRQVFDGTPGVEAYKGGGRSLPVENPRFPVPEDDEMLTRVDSSVHVNSDGVPVYVTRERSLVNRFQALLSRLGEVPATVYSRDRYELRYPKYLHSMFREMDYVPDFAALVDEAGEIRDGKLVAGGREVAVDDFRGDLHSRDRRLELALERGDSGEVSRIISEEAGRVEKLV